MSNVDNVEPNVPLAPTWPPRRLRRSTIVWGAIGSIIAVLAAVLIAASFIKVDYVIIGPGQTYVANERVSVSGEIPFFEPRGQVRFVTVSERVEPTLLDKLQADYNDDDAVLPRKDVLGDQTPEENNAANQAAMTSSKDVAALVALRKLGYDVPSDVLITQIVPDAPAAAVAKEGEVIAAIDGTAITSTPGLRGVLGSHAPGDTIELELIDTQGNHRTASVTLGENPDQAAVSRAFLGVALSDRPRLPFQVNIDTSQVGGPSAGLAFTLAILDVLTPGELTGGQVIAATGQMFSDGTIGAIGGIAQKVVTVKDAGVKVFLVPADDRCGEPDGSCNYTDAKAKAGDRIQVFPVHTLEDALVALSNLGGNALALGEPGKTPAS